MRARPSYANGFARYAAESKAPELWRGLVEAWCPFLGNTGPTLLQDMSGHYNHSTINGATWVQEQYGQVLNLDGNDYINIANQSTPSAFTIAALVKYPDVAADKRLFASSEAVNYGFVFWMDAGGLADGWALAVNGSGGQTIVGVDSANAVANKWQFVCATWDGNNMAVYVDGQLGDSASGQTTIHAITEYNIGWFESSNQFFTGQVAFLCFWERSISINEIGFLYSNPFVIWELDYTPYAIAPVVANDLLLLTQTNLRGNLQVLDGGL